MASPKATAQTSQKADDTDAKAEKNETNIYISGVLTIDEQAQQEVAVVAQHGKETRVQLSKPVVLGNALTIGTWLNNTCKTPVPVLLVKKPQPPGGKIELQANVSHAEVVQHLEELQLPPQGVELIAKLLTAEVVLQDLYIHRYTEGDGTGTSGNKTARTAFKFAAAVDFQDSTGEGLPLFGDIKLKNVAVGITSAPRNYAFRDAADMPDFEPGDFKKLKRVVEAEKILAIEEEKKESEKVKAAAPTEGQEATPAAE